MNDSTRHARRAFWRRTGTGALVLVTLLGGCVVAPAGYYQPPPAGPVVDSEPPAPQYEVVPASPGVGYVWIGGYWGWQAGRHVWIGGRWALPPAGHAWVPGRWVRHPRGWAWHGGYWGRR